MPPDSAIDLLKASCWEKHAGQKPLLWLNKVFFLFYLVSFSNWRIGKEKYAGIFLPRDHILITTITDSGKIFRSYCDGSLIDKMNKWLNNITEAIKKITHKKGEIRCFVHLASQNVQGE